jgi:hypothetical protein
MTQAIDFAASLWDFKSLVSTHSTIRAPFVFNELPRDFVLCCSDPRHKSTGYDTAVAQKMHSTASFFAGMAHRITHCRCFEKITQNC